MVQLILAIRAVKKIKHHYQPYASQASNNL